MRQIQPKSYLAELWGVLTPTDRRQAIILLAFMIIGMGFEMLGIGFIVPVIQLLANPEVLENNRVFISLYNELGRPNNQTMVMIGVVGLVGIYICKAAFLGLQYWREMRFAFGLQADISQRLFDTYLGQSYTFHLQRNSAELIRNIVIEVAQLIANCVLPALLLAAETLVLAGLFILLLIIEPIGALAALLVLGGGGWLLHRVTGRYLSHWGSVRQIHEALRLQRLQEGLGGAKDVILSGREAEFMRQYGTHNQRTTDVYKKQKFLQKLPQLWLELLAICGLATLILTMVARGGAMADMLPTLGVFAAAAFRMLPSANRIVGAVQSLRYGVPVIVVIAAELHLPKRPTPPVKANHSVFIKQVEFDNVSYGYPGSNDYAVRDLSLTVYQGETIGLIGASGAGKSTVVDLFLGLIQPQQGVIKVDGADIQLHMRAWQNQIGYVPQTIFLSDDTLRRNVAFGLAAEEIDDAVVWHALHMAQLQDFVESLPERLDTTLGERGIRLSGGQRQRIGIARALYHNPSVLVLDEATSALDTDTEREVMEAVWALQGQKTIIIVAHRVTTLSCCSSIYSISRGGIDRVYKEGDLFG